MTVVVAKKTDRGKINFTEFLEILKKIGAVQRIILESSPGCEVLIFTLIKLSIYSSYSKQ